MPVSGLDTLSTWALHRWYTTLVLPVHGLDTGASRLRRFRTPCLEQRHDAKSSRRETMSQKCVSAMKRNKFSLFFLRFFVTLHDNAVRVSFTPSHQSKHGKRTNRFD